MANIVRREPTEYLSLRSAMDRLFDDSILRPLGGDGGIAAPAIDLAETIDAVVVTAAVPGIKPDDLKITLTGDVLQISGEVTSESEHKDATYHVRELRVGSFRRAVPLPAPVISDKAKAEFENGVLTLTMPKAEEARPKAIKVLARK